VLATGHRADALPDADRVLRIDGARLLESDIANRSPRGAVTRVELVAGPGARPADELSALGGVRSAEPDARGTTLALVVGADAVDRVLVGAIEAGWSVARVVPLEVEE
jgi:hypothetical protein